MTDIPHAAHTPPDAAALANEQASEHRIKIVVVERIGGSQWYRAVCELQDYQSGLHGTPESAQRAGRDHVTAKAT